jgi:hypothetical protein
MAVFGALMVLEVGTGLEVGSISKNGHWEQWWNPGLLRAGSQGVSDKVQRDVSPGHIWDFKRAE